MTLQTTLAAEPLRAINPPELFDPTGFGYSQVILAPAGRTVYFSGQGGMDAQGRLSDDFAAQVDQAFANLRAAMTGAGAGPDRIARITLYVVDHEPAKLGPITSAVIATFGTTLPAQTLVPVPKLALDGMLFEIEAIAVID